MKDTHLIIALYRALDRYGSSTKPQGAKPDLPRPAGSPPHQDRRRSPGWVTAAEVEASQSPNTIPKLTQRTIGLRCEALVRRHGSPVLQVDRSGGEENSWILVAPPGEERERAWDPAEGDGRPPDEGP